MKRSKSKYTLGNVGATKISVCCSNGRRHCTYFAFWSVVPPTIKSGRKAGECITLYNACRREVESEIYGVWLWYEDQCGVLASPILSVIFASLRIALEFCYRLTLSSILFWRINYMLTMRNIQKRFGPKLLYFCKVSYSNRKARQNVKTIANFCAREKACSNFE